MAPLLQNPIHSKLAAYRSASQFTAPAETSSGPQAAPPTTALSIEFVAKPSEAHRIQTALPPALHGTLQEVAGFAGALVFIANYEARLVTVVTLWTGEDRMRQSSANLKWVRALLNPYLDRCLRVQTLAAFTPNMDASARTSPTECQTGVLTVAERRVIEEQDVAFCAA